jgi:hypothetical protein
MTVKAGGKSAFVGEHLLRNPHQLIVAEGLFDYLIRT